MTTIPKEITNSEDLIDSRDVIKRIEWLTHNCDAEEAIELRELLKLQEDCDADDWLHGECLIRESYFETYAQDLAEDIGAINPEAAWPATCIDWEQAARELLVDYSACEFDGVTYYYR